MCGENEERITKINSLRAAPILDKMRKNKLRSFDRDMRRGIAIKQRQM
jgi:hypothetical protein